MVISPGSHAEAVYMTASLKAKDKRQRAKGKGKIITNDRGGLNAAPADNLKAKREK